MSALETLKELVRGRVETYVPTLDPFLEIDVDALAADMRLEALGKERGEAELPPSDAGALDDIELSVVEKIENEAGRAYRECVNELRVLDNRLYGLDLVGTFGRARTAATSAIADFVAEARLAQAQLSQKRKAVQQVAKHIENFRREHNVTHLAQEPLSGLAFWGSVSSAVILEAGINSVFLRVNDDLGYLGGAVMALAIAVVNVFIATTFGKLVMPQKNSVKPLVRIRAGLLLTAYVIIAAGLNLLGAHYRYLKGLGVDNPSGAAIQSFFADPIGIPDYVSWLLVAFGLGCSFLALWAGYRSDDEYPGYGRVSRQYDDVITDYNDALAEAHDKLGAIKDEAVQAAGDLEQRLSRDRREYEAALLSRTSLLGLYAARHPNLETAGNRLLNIYRTANRKARSTPAPAHFDHRWTLRSLAEPSAAPPPDHGGNLDEELAETRRALSDAAQEMSEAFVKHIESFKPLDESDS
jgi:hypothetical protein